MLPAIPSVLREKEDRSLASYSVSQIDNFPSSQYNENLSKYNELESWYDGSALEALTLQQGKEVSTYPVKINPLQNFVEKHVATLFGEVMDDDRPLVIPKVFESKTSGSGTKRSKRVEEILNTLWYENNGRAIQLENGYISNIFGGCIYKLTYVPWETWREVPLRIERILPKNFIGRTDASDFFRLKEAWIIDYVSYQEALELGVNIEEDSVGVFVDYWSTKVHRTTINGQICSRVNPDGSVHVFNENNTLGIVPVVYIPHIRAGKFYGESMLSPLLGMVKELNLRTADYGDAISDDSHPYIAMRNVNGSPNIIKLANGLNVINLGSSQSGLTTADGQPDMFTVSKGSASEPMSDINQKIFNQLRRDSHVPAIADGEDEGSQRSALTLAMRMWPLTSHARMERINWETGLNLLHRYAIQMLIAIGYKKILAEDIKAKLRCSWYSFLPKDRDSVINEVVSLAGSNLGSPQKLIDKLGDVDDPEEEIKLIKDWIQTLADIQANAMQKAMPVQNNGGPGSPSNANATKAKANTKNQPKKTDGG
jgi:hypothetical protein